MLDTRRASRAARHRRAFIRFMLLATGTELMVGYLIHLMR